MYGLNDAARQWYIIVKEVIKSQGCIQSKFDPALFQYYSDNRLEGFLLIHVEDFIHTGSNCFAKSISEPLQKTFLTGKQSDTDFKYIGLNILQKKDSIEILSQKDYANSIKLVEILIKHQYQKFH